MTDTEPDARGEPVRGEGASDAGSSPGSTRRSALAGGDGSWAAFRSMVAWDVRLQVRYGFYAVYAVLTVAFVVGLRLLEPALRTDATVLLVVTDPTLLGFYFIAALVLFEKEEGVLAALVTTPLGDRGYLASKVLTLSLLAVVASTIVVVLGHGASPPGLALLAGTVAASASLFVLAGFVAVARFDSINEYFIGAVGWGTVLFLPLFGYVGVVETRLFYLLPTQATLLLVEGTFRPLSAWQYGYGVAVLAVGNAVAYAWARRSFRRHIVRGGDPGRQLGRDPARGSAPSGRRSPAVALALADLRNWVRDPVLAVAAVGPLALATVVRFGAPTVEALARPVLSIEPSYPVIAGAMTVFGPAIYGFVVGMFVLQDREQGVLAAYRTSPLTGRGYLLYRGATAYALSVAATLPAMIVIGLVPASPRVVVAAVAIGALGGPLWALAFASLAANTIEGLAISKLVNLVVLAPAVAIAAVPEPAQFAAGAVPTYWPIKTYAAGVAGDPAWPLYALVGAAVNLAAIWLLRRRFLDRAD